MDDMIIRPANADDAARLSEIGATVFVESYNHPYDQAAMDAYVDETFGKARIAEEIGSPTIYYFVAETDRIVGFVKFKTWVWTPRFKGKITFEIERLYILKELEGNKIGSRLMQRAVSEGLKKKYSNIWLSVWENNERAISFHKHNGFEVIGDGMFTLGATPRKYLVMKYRQEPSASS